ncbi:hypothetical protein BKA80DRAFT_286437 [Phyllosticta citrichinensis]
MDSVAWHCKTGRRREGLLFVCLFVRLGPSCHVYVVHQFGSSLKPTSPFSLLENKTTARYPTKSSSLLKRTQGIQGG